MLIVFHISAWVSKHPGIAGDVAKSAIQEIAEVVM